MYTVDLLRSKNWKIHQRSKIPLKYIDRSIEEYIPTGKSEKEKNHNKRTFEEFMDYYENLETHLLNGTGLILCGPVGVGKTFLMTHLSKKAYSIFDYHNGQIQENDIQTDKNNRFYYIQATRISQLVFPQGLNEKELNLRRNLKTLAGLWIDDISKMSETKSKAEINFLDDVLRWRDLNKFPTFYTSQLPFNSVKNGPGLDAALQGPIHDIIKGNCKVLSFLGESKRILNTDYLEE